MTLACSDVSSHNCGVCFLILLQRHCAIRKQWKNDFFLIAFGRAWRHRKNLEISANSSALLAWNGFVRAVRARRGKMRKVARGRQKAAWSHCKEFTLSTIVIIIFHVFLQHKSYFFSKQLPLNIHDNHTAQLFAAKLLSSFLSVLVCSTATPPLHLAIKTWPE